MKKIIIISLISLLVANGVDSFAADDINNIRATIYAWQEAWQSKDINRYKLFYSKKFKSDGFDYHGWIKKKERIFAMPGDISVELFDLDISVQDDEVIATFIQRYKSPTLSDDGEKTLVLIQSDDMYKIVAEQFTPLETPSPSEVEALFGEPSEPIKPTQPVDEPPEPKVEPVEPKDEPAEPEPVKPAPVAKRVLSDASIQLSALTRAQSLSETLQVISKKDEWRQIRASDGGKRWINTHLLKESGVDAPQTTSSQADASCPDDMPSAIGSRIAPKERTLISKTNLEWIYQSASTASKKLMRLTKGKPYLAVKYDGDWVGLQLNQNVIGWAHQKHLKMEDDGVAVTSKKRPLSKPKPSKPTRPSVLERAEQKETAPTRMVKWVTPKVSFARAYEKPTIDSMILFRLEQGKRYILLGSHGDWLQIQTDNGQTGWGHQTLFNKKVETGRAPAALIRKETKKFVPKVGDFPPGTLPSDKAARTKPADVQPPVEKKTPPADEEDSSSGVQIPETAPSQDEPSLFTHDEDFITTPDEEEDMEQPDAPGESQPSAAKDSTEEEEEVQLEIKSSNELTPTVSLVRVYSKPSTDARILFWLTKGKTYRFTDTKDGWYHIQLDDGRRGWAHLALYMDGSRVRTSAIKETEPVDINQKLTSVVILGGAHEKPALDSKVVFRLEKGETYTAEKKQGSWYLIKNDRGEAGWAHKSLFETGAVQKPTDEDKTEKRVNAIRFELTPNGSEKVLFDLSGFYPPDVFLMEESQSTLICDFSEIQTLHDLKPVINIDQEFVKQIRTQMHEGALRVFIDLQRGKSYDVRQVFFKKENLFTLIFSTDES